MQIKFVLFDLDGTLLPMDQNKFIKAYFGGLAAKLAPLGYGKKELVDAVWSGTAKMVQNDGSRPNEEVFWEEFISVFGEKVKRDLPLFDEFYNNDFDSVKEACGFDARAKQTVYALKARGIRLALATNPIFPAVATQKRMAWAGLVPEDFELYTTYENSRHCKPNPDYYRDILNSLGAQPEECLMVGNDVREDMVAETLGMKVFLLTDCLINTDGRDISVYPHGSFDELNEYLKCV